MLSSIDWINVVVALWVVVVAAHAVVVLIARRRLTRVIANATPAALEATLDVKALADRLGLRRCPAVYATGDVVSPQAVGVWRPVIVLPERFSERVTPDAWRMALCHELEGRLA